MLYTAGKSKSNGLQASFSALFFFFFKSKHYLKKNFFFLRRIQTTKETNCICLQMFKQNPDLFRKMLD